MDSGVIAKLFQTAPEYTFTKGQAVIAFGNSEDLYFIRQGFIKRFAIDKLGNNSIQSVYGPQFIFPLSPLFLALFDQKVSQSNAQYIYMTMSDVVVRKMSVTDIINEAETKPRVYKALLFEAGRRLKSNVQQLENLALKDAFRRVANQLVFLAQEFGEKEPAGIRITLPVTQQDISEMLSLSRETVSRQFTRLRLKGIINYDKSLIITDMPKLLIVSS